MSETKKTLQLLRPSLPAYPPPVLGDEEVEEFSRGFQGDIAPSTIYVTDGHICLLRSAIDPALSIKKCDEESPLIKSESRVDAVWKPAQQRVDVSADFLGVLPYLDAEIAFVRDSTGRLMVLDAYLLAFGVLAVHPDALTIDAAPIEATCLRRGQVPWFHTPLALRCGGELVGLLMPMKFDVADFKDFDLTGPPAPLVVAARESEAR